MPLDLRSYSACEFSHTASAVAAGLGICTLYPFQTPPLAYNPQLGLVSLSVQLLTAVESTIALVAPVSFVAPFALQQGRAVSAMQNDSDTMGYVGIGWDEFTPADLENPLYCYRKVTLPAVIGNGVTWEWPETDPLTVSLGVGGLGAGSAYGLVLANAGAGAMANILVSWRWLEYAP
jgi:hypothetical protein